MPKITDLLCRLVSGDHSLDQIKAAVESGLGSVHETCGDDGITPLHVAANHGSLVVVQYLVDKGANLGAKTHQEGLDPLAFAVLNSQLEVARFLVERGAEPDPKDKHGLPLSRRVKKLKRQLLK